MRRAVAASLLVAGLALTGCAEAEDDEGDDGTSIVDEGSGEDEGDGEDSEDE